MRPTNQERQAMRERAERATKGPWTYVKGIMKHYVYSQNDDVHLGLQELHPGDGHEVPAAANADFIAHARTDLPTLLDALDEAEQEIKRLKVLVAYERGRIPGQVLVNIAPWVGLKLEYDLTDPDAYRAGCDAVYTKVEGMLKAISEAGAALVQAAGEGKE